MLATVRRGYWGVPGALLGLSGVLVLILGYRALSHPPPDLEVYLLGGSVAWSGGDDLYAAASLSSLGLPFTYPPFAAVTFVPLTAAGLTAASLAIVAVSLACLLRICYLVIVRSGFCRTYRITVPNAVVGTAIATLVLEPATSNLTLGQLNLVLCWAVVEDVLGPRRRTTGILVGLAAGIKLVPGLFVAYFLLTRQWRAAMLAAATAVLTVGVGFVLLPGSSVTFWSTLGRLQNRVAADTFSAGGLSQVTNQSVLGTLNRLFGPDVRVLWLVIAVALLTIAGTTVWLLGRDRPVDSVVALALAGLLASPVSWTHHWVWTTPLVIVLLVRARTPELLVRVGGIALAAAWIFTAAVRLVLVSDGVGTDPNIARYYRILGANAYVVLGVLSLGYLAWLAVRRAGRRPLLRRVRLHRMAAPPSSGPTRGQSVQ